MKEGGRLTVAHGKTRAYKKLMDAVADFDVVNAQLDALQKELADEII